MDNEKIKEIVKFLEKTIDTQETTVTVIERKAVLLATFCTTVMGYILAYDAGLWDTYIVLIKHFLADGLRGSSDALRMLAGEHQRIIATGLYAAIIMKMLAVFFLSLGVLCCWDTLRTNKYQFKGVVWDEPSNEILGDFAALLVSAEKHYKKAIATNDIAVEQKANSIKLGIFFGLLGAQCSFYAIVFENGASLLIAAG